MPRLTTLMLPIAVIAVALPTVGSATREPDKQNPSSSTTTPLYGIGKCEKTRGQKASCGEREGGWTFAPKRFEKAPEVAAVVFDRLTQKFVAVQYDRGEVQSVDATAGSVTIVQRQRKVVWRTQAFSVPAGTVIIVNGQPSTLAGITPGMSARIMQSGAPGSPLTVVRVSAKTRGDAMPVPSVS